MSLPSNSVEPHTAQPANPNSPGHQSVNQSPEQAFEMPLFPGYVRATHPLGAGAKSRQVKDERTTQPLKRAAEHRSETTRQHDLTAVVERQIQQHNELSNQVQAQTRITHEKVKGLRHQMERQEQRYQSELRRLEQTLTHRLETVVNQNTQTQHNQAAQSPSPAAERKTILSNVPTTYQVPRRTQVTWVEKLLGAIPAFVWLFVLGMTIAGLSAIALSPTVLWPSLSLSIRSVIPVIFITGLVGLGITAVWDTFR